MNKSVRNGLIVGVTSLIFIGFLSYILVNKKNVSNNGWIISDIVGDKQKIYIETQKISFDLPILWKSMSNKETSMYAKFYGEYGDVDKEVSEGVGNGCQFWSYQKEKINSIDVLRELVLLEQESIKNEFGITEFETNEITILNRPTLTVKYRNDGWGNFIDYYVLDKESTYVLSLIYGDEKEGLCKKILEDIIQSLRINDD